jgi:hypothetical protein
VALTKITNHVARALARVRVQWQDDENYISLVTALARPSQNLEDAAWDLLTMRSIDNAEGVQLDQLGEIVQQRRDGLTDDEYRPCLRARVAVNNSDGTLRDLYKVTRLFLSDANAVIRVPDTYGNGSLEMEIVSPAQDSADMQRLVGFLQDAASGGVRIVLLYSEVEDRADGFAFALSTFAAGSITAGATSVTVTSTAGFPDTGSITFDQGLATEETVTYAGKTATTFFGMTALADNHADTCQIAWADSPGDGFGAGYMSSMVEE